ncbi:LPD1 domain-containing protein [Bacillus mycoides]|uniref:Large polyvalent protein-associated domain-containing protein n=1 Tax=Bacillus mycoides TaxID=1405 RepID=A0ABC9QUV1_BACMY|nr:LPD1 domain-containing protein [Bacillus mycoides]EJR29901.1 hypothetical protein III_05670 [Bacillus mycoides]
MNLFEMFDLEVGENVMVQDVRTDKQVHNRYSYDVGEKLVGAKKELRALKESFLVSFSLEILAEIEKESATEALNALDRNTLISFSFEQEKENDIPPHVAKLKQLLVGRINKKPIVDTPTARKLYVQACRRIWRDIQSVHTSQQWVDLVVSYGMEMSNGWSAFRKDKNVTYTFKRMVEEYFDEFVDADGMELLILGKKFISLCTNSKSINSTYHRVSHELTWNDLLTKKVTTRKKSAAAWSRKLPDTLQRKGPGVELATKPEDVVAMFGLKGMQFGHYCTEQYAKEHIGHVSEALHDLARILGIPPEYIGLGGRLGLAIGARGSGNALAHYEPSTKVINLTRDNGVGALCHEWSHALDHFLYDCSHDFQNGSFAFLSSGKSVGNILPAIIKERMQAVLDACKQGKVDRVINVESAYDRKWYFYGSVINSYDVFKGNVSGILESHHLSSYRKLDTLSGAAKTRMERKIEKDFEKTAQMLAAYHYKKAGEKLDEISYQAKGSVYFDTAIKLDKKRTKKYWSTNHEMFARAFEAYVESALLDQEHRSDYLVCDTHSFVYPLGEQREHLNRSIKSLMEVTVPYIINSIQGVGQNEL